MRKVEIPIWEKINLTVEEASAYSNIGRDKIYDLTSEPNCKFLLKNGRVTLIKRKAFEEFLSQKSVI